MEINLTALLEIPSISRIFLWFFTALTLRTWFSQEGFSSQGIKGNRFGKAVKSNGHCIDLLSRRVYQGFFCHVGVTSIIASTFYWRTLFITRPIKLKGGYAKANIFFQSCCIASVAKLFGSGFHAIYLEVGNTAWRETDQLLGFLKIWLFSEKLSDEILNWISLHWLWSDEIADNSKLTCFF